jgi:hypothetical protein
LLSGLDCLESRRKFSGEFIGVCTDQFLSSLCTCPGALLRDDRNELDNGVELIALWINIED